MPSKKDFISIKQGEQRIHVQKNNNLKELYQLLKENHRWKSKFAELRPKHCVLAGATPFVCALFIKM